MRRTMLLLVAVGLLGSLPGCHIMHSHGICDCEEDNHCQDRAPWLQRVAPNAMPSEPIRTPPVKLPDVKKKDL